MLFKQKRLDEILEHWSDYVERHPRDVVAIYERSGTHYHNGDMDSARRDVERACRLGHEDACRTQRRFANR